LQGTFEKIEPHGFFSKQSLQLMNLLAQRSTVSAEPGRPLQGGDSVGPKDGIRQETTASSRKRQYGVHDVEVGIFI